jgi:quercetin dioxygenase-like cupin family protein
VDVIAEGDTSTVYGGRFSGPVELEMLRLAPDGSIPDVAVVRFAAGSVSTWHAHPGGQLLYVLEGRARVGTEPDGTVELAPGTLVVSPPGERHWHGAAAGEPAAVLSLAWGTTAWEELLPDLAADY